MDASTLEQIADFSHQRNWDQFHTPKDLAISISLEAAELLECFQWSGTDMQALDKSEKIEEEVADVLIYALRLCQVLGVTPDDIIRNKIQLNDQKYPADKAFGNARKYTELASDLDEGEPL
ncbi:MAG: nucleotide pyrophosphohydrolase [Clostridiales bacterium]|nr:nucleotide pyrophosphohydrolase [Clostridiales bacterium]